MLDDVVARLERVERDSVNEMCNTDCSAVIMGSCRTVSLFGLGVATERAEVHWDNAQAPRYSWLSRSLSDTRKAASDEAHAAP
jgi:hypothetical protein